LFFLQVSPDEMDIFEEIKSFLGDDENKDSKLIAPFSLLSKNAMESLRYRAKVIVQLLSFSQMTS
jgi:ATP-dependent RNA helicase DDX56/DBP9